MGGIAGIWSAHPPASPEEMTRRLEAMAASLSHRGPDGTGTWTDGRVGLAHRRLAVIDLTPAGRQPMTDALGRMSIVHNGEVYNFRELKAALEAQGHRFRSRTDTEVILNAYRRWDLAFVERLRGMFAFALWDGERRRLVLARDRAGQKPLYYRRHDGDLLFGSEIKAILTWPGVPRKPDLTALHHYLTFAYVPGPGTAFEGVAKLPPGHLMVVEANGEVRLHRYWSLPWPERVRHRPVGELGEELLARLDEAVQLRLVSDVPLGAFLSGGLDSGCVVAAMARVSNATIKTFTIGFDERADDERALARAVARRHGTEHHEEVVRPDALSLLPRLVWHYGEPFADASTIPTYYLAEVTRRHVTVALTGDGGNEIFMGHQRFVGCQSLAMADALPLPLRRAVAAVGRRLPLERFPLAPVRWGCRFLAEMASTPCDRYATWIARFSDREKAELYGEALGGELARSSLDLLQPWFERPTTPAAKAAWADLHTYLPDDVLVKADVGTMAHGLEARSPLLDYELMAFAATIPASQKIAGLQTKVLFRWAMQPYLPRRLLSGAKRSFNPPIGRWLRGELKALAYDTLLSKRATQRGLFRTQAVRRLLDEHAVGRRDHRERIWALLMLELWFRTWIDPPYPPSTPA